MTPSKPLAPGVSYAAVVGFTLARLREKASLSQAELADAAGLKQAAWSKVERGVTAANIEHLTQAAARLELPVSAILRRADRAVDQLVRLGVQVCAGRDLGVDVVEVSPRALRALLLSSTPP